jgi:hypothetical protein
MFSFFSLDDIISLSTKYNNTNNSKKCRQKKYQHTFEVTTFTRQPPKFAGKNTIFSRYKTSFFLLDFNYKKHFRIVSNNKKLKDFSFYSDRTHPSLNFIISNFINGVFRFLNFHNNISEIERQKYFNIVRHQVVSSEAQETSAEYFSRLRARDQSDPQLHQQRRRHVEPASSATDFNPIVESLPVPEGFMRRRHAPK